MKPAESRPGPGRPRAFDPERALDAALAVFWQHGYEGASLPALTAAMGINRPSLDATFGNKEALFQAALARYQQTRLAFVPDALAQPSARAVVDALLTGYARLGTTPGSPRGCLAVNSALACSDGADPIRQQLIAGRIARLATLRRRLEQARRDGDLPRDSDTAGLARFVMAVAQGMAVQAASGATRAQLLPLVEHALVLFPELPHAVPASRTSPVAGATHTRSPPR